MIKIICVGKIKEQYLINLIEDYQKRINKYHKLEIIEVPDSNINEEAKKIILKIDKGYNIALVKEGIKCNSIEFSKLVNEKLMHEANINFIIGGSDGLGEKVLNKSNLQLSFSDITFPHGLFRGILLEQIYRSFKIQNNETYHK